MQKGKKLNQAIGHARQENTLINQLFATCIWLCVFHASMTFCQFVDRYPQTIIRETLSLSVNHFANLCFLYYSLNMTVDSFCLPNYYGDTCSTYCYPNTRYTCDRYGRKQCKRGILIDTLLSKRCMLTIV